VADKKTTKLLDKLTDTQGIRINTLLDQLNKPQERMTEPVPGAAGPFYRQYSETPKLEESKSRGLVEAIKSPGLSNQKVPELKGLELTSPKVDRSAYEAAVGEAALKQEMATKDYNKAKERTDWLRVAETVGKALVRMGAAQQGLRDNVDLSNVGTGPGADWASLLGEDAAIRDILVSDSKSRLSNQKELQSIKDADAKDLADLRNREVLADYQQRVQDRERALDINRQNELERFRVEKSDKAAERDNNIRAAMEAAKQEAKPQPVDKLAKERNEAANRIYAAKLTGDDAELRKAMMAESIYFAPEEMEKLVQAADKGFGNETEAKNLLSAIREIGSAGQGAQAGADSTIQAYADQNKLTYEKARDILVKRGYSPKE
jgi:hypothetical protein